MALSLDNVTLGDEMQKVFNTLNSLVNNLNDGVNTVITVSSEANLPSENDRLSDLYIVENHSIINKPCVAFIVNGTWYLEELDNVPYLTRSSAKIDAVDKGAGVVTNKLVYFDPTTEKWELADSSNEAKLPQAIWGIEDSAVFSGLYYSVILTLTKGTKYFCDANGNLTTTDTGVTVGTAISSTSILLEIGKVTVTDLGDLAFKDLVTNADIVDETISLEKMEVDLANANKVVQYDETGKQFAGGVQLPYNYVGDLDVKRTGIQAIGNTTQNTINNTWFIDNDGKLNSVRDFDTGSDTFECYVDIEAKDIAVGNNDFIVLGESTPNYACVLRFTGPTNKMQIYLSSNGTSWDLASSVLGTATFVDDTRYQIKFEKTLTQYIISYSTDGLLYDDPGKIWITDITVSNSTNLHSTKIAGLGGFSNNFGLTFYSDNCYYLFGSDEAILPKDLIIGNAIDVKCSSLYAESDNGSVGSIDAPDFITSEQTTHLTTIIDNSPIYNENDKTILFEGKHSVSKRVDISADEWVAYLDLEYTSLSGIFDIISSYNIDNNIHGFVLRINSGTLEYYLSSNGTSWDLASAVFGTKSDWVINTRYQLRIRKTLNTYEVDFSTDGKQYDDGTKVWINDITISESTPLFANGGVSIGDWITTSPDSASMKLHTQNTYVEFGGVPTLTPDNLMFRGSLYAFLVDDGNNTTVEWSNTSNGESIDNTYLKRYIFSTYMTTDQMKNFTSHFNANYLYINYTTVVANSVTDVYNHLDKIPTGSPANVECQVSAFPNTNNTIGGLCPEGVDSAYKYQRNASGVYILTQDSYELTDKDGKLTVVEFSDDSSIIVFYSNGYRIGF